MAKSTDVETKPIRNKVSATLRHWGALLDQVERVLLVVFGASVLVLVMIQVFSRYLVIGTAVSWTEELARMVLVWLTFLGAVYLMTKREHLQVTLIIERLQGTTRKVVLLVCHVIEFCIIMTIIYYSIPFLKLSTTELTPTLQWPRIVLYAPFVGLLGIMAIWMFVTFLRDARALGKGW